MTPTIPGSPFDLDKALVDLGKDRFGHYTSVVTLGSQDVTETGEYDVATRRYQLEKRVSTPDGAYVFHVRHLGKDASYVSYVQRADPGGQVSCWARIRDRAVREAKRANGIDFAIAPLPGPLVSLLSLETAGAERVGDVVHANEDAYLGLTLLGIGEPALQPIAGLIDGHLVPIDVHVAGDGHINGADVDGRSVRDALAADGVDLPSATANSLPLMRSTLEIDRLGTPVAVVAPPASDVVPLDDQWDSCHLPR
ncbi:MAG: hypothetical protein ACJ72E_02085 [Marmoricola sp.]